QGGWESLADYSDLDVAPVNNGASKRQSPSDRPKTEDPDAETSRPHPIRLFADRRAQRLQLAGRQAARLLRRAQYRAFRLRRRARDGSGAQRPADHAQFRLARLWQPNRQLAPVRDLGRAQTAGHDSSQQQRLLSLPPDRRKDQSPR